MCRIAEVCSVRLWMRRLIVFQKANGRRQAATELEIGRGLAV